MIGEPYTIAQIPPDLTGKTGKLFTSDVNAVSGSGKKKRSEIAIAIDRQGINVYDVIRVHVVRRNLSTDVYRFVHRS